MPADHLAWKRKQEDNRELFSLMSARGDPERGLKALGEVQIGCCTGAGREREWKRVGEGTTRSGRGCGLSEALKHPRVKVLGAGREQ